MRLLDLQGTHYFALPFFFSTLSTRIFFGFFVRDALLNIVLESLSESPQPASGSHLLICSSTRGIAALSASMPLTSDSPSDAVVCSVMLSIDPTCVPEDSFLVVSARGGGGCRNLEMDKCLI